MCIRPRVAKHLWENRHNNQMNLKPYDQDKRVMETQIAKTKDEKPVIKMVTPVDQATEMAELKRERGALQRKLKTEASTGQTLS